MKHTSTMMQVCEAAAIFGARVSRRGRVSLSSTANSTRSVRRRAQSLARRVYSDLHRPDLHRADQSRLRILTGASGIGKSLTLRALAHFAQIRGDLVIHARPARSNRTALELLRLPLQHALAALSRAGLADVAAIFSPAANLSTGQQARLGIAIAFARVIRARRAGSNRRILILADEFCTPLDDETTHAVCRGVQAFLAETANVAVVAATARLPNTLPDTLVIELSEQEQS